MFVRRMLRPAMAGALMVFGVSAGAVPVGQGGGLTALDRLESGQWQLRETSDGGVRSVCVSKPESLLQIRHSGVQCSRFVLENSQDVTTIRYTCPSQGHGRTTVSVETPRLMRLSTQGMAQGAPFQLEFEGRRTGACAAGGGAH